MVGHGIILGGMLERPDQAELRNQRPGDYNEPEFWPNTKRSAGAHRIATFLREQDWDIEVLDYWPCWKEEELFQFLDSRITDETVFIGFSAMFPMGGALQKARELMATIAKLKERYPNQKFIGGAMNASAIWMYPLDYHCTGFGEKGVLELLKHIKGEPSEVVITERTHVGITRQVVECDTYHPSYPMADAWVQYEDRDYIQPSEVLTIELARGCKFRCKFCSNTVLGIKGDYSRCADSLFEELWNNYTDYGVNVYTVSDETINDNPEKLAKFAKAINKLPFDVHLQGFIRADLLVANPDTWQDIWDMGLWTHLYGIETLNHDAGKYVGKGMNPDRLKEGLLRARDWFQNKGKYRVGISTIVGLPGEPKESIFKTKEWIKTNFPGQAYTFSPLMIMQGEVYNMMTNPSILDQTWREEMEEMTEQEIADCDYSTIPEEYHQIVKFYMESPGTVKWKHEHMNFFEAWQTMATIASDKDLTKNLAPMTFDYHKYLNHGKYNINDMCKSFNEIESYGPQDVPHQLAWIEQYKRRKLI